MSSRAASSRSNQLTIPFRTSTHFSLSSSIREYIGSKYDQDVKTFEHDLEVIDRLRHDAINVKEAHSSGVKKLQAYAAQLEWMGGKFPVKLADFSWYPALGYNTDRPVTHRNLKYELLNVLFNLAALYCQLAVSTNNGDPAGLPMAAGYYSQAAGVLTHMKIKVLPGVTVQDAVPDDMDETTLEALTQLMLAQSQECYWLRAVSENYKDATIAKLAARVSDLYSATGEASVRSEAISSAWIHHTSAKHHHFAAVAQYRASLDCLEKRKYGEEIARLKDALQCSEEGLREARGGYLSKIVQEELEGLRRRLEEDLKRAERDNDVIYLNPVPPKSELKILGRANMAVPRVPREVESPLEYLGDHTDFGPPLFANLVPLAVHLAISTYEQVRDRRIKEEIIEPLENLDAQLHEALSSLNLPGSFQALDSPLGLPPSLTSHADEIRQADAVNRLETDIADIDKRRASAEAIFNEGKAFLEAEKEEDGRLRKKYGTQRWARPKASEDAEGSQLWKRLSDNEGYLAVSASSDARMREKFASVREALRILGGSERGLLDYVPSSRKAEVPETLKPALGRLRSAYSDILRLESRRRRRIEAVLAKARADDVMGDIVKEAARLERTYPNTALDRAHFDAFSTARVTTTYQAESELVEKEKAEQEKVLSDATIANREFEAQKRHAGGRGGREREAALQKLDEAYFKCKELLSNVEEARKFYQDLGKVMTQFRDHCRDWAQRRRNDAEMLEEELAMPLLSSLSISRQQQQQQQQQQAVRSPPPAQGYSPMQSPNQFYSTNPLSPRAQAQPVSQAVRSPVPDAQIQSWADSVPPQQPKPITPAQQIWTPDMNIRFAPGPPANVGNGQQGTSKPSGTWDPSSGIRFG